MPAGATGRPLSVTVAAAVTDQVSVTIAAAGSRCCWNWWISGKDADDADDADDAGDAGSPGSGTVNA